MPKMKISKSVKDRFKVSGGGKIMRRKIGVRHLRSSKSAANLRRAKVPVEITGELKRKINSLLGI